MTTLFPRRSSVAAAVALAAGAFAAASMMGAAPHRATMTVAQFTPAGDLVRPEGYREWVYVGTPLTPNDMNNGAAAFPEFHNVYINPEAWKHYTETGEFPEGTTHSLQPTDRTRGRCRESGDA